jgi:23S rRNA pseudouridine2605 synthase
MAERLQKWLAARGYGSRRSIEKLIIDGRVSVDGATAQLGQKVAGSERIVVDGKAVRGGSAAPAVRTIMYHKPAGEICSRRDPEGRPTVFQSLPRLHGNRWVTVGRLDFQTTGLLLLTTDGELAHQLMHPSSELAREYIVRAQGRVDQAQLDRLLEGVELDDGPARFTALETGAEQGANRSYRVTVCEGRNRIVRRLFEAVGCRVNRLMRVRYGPVELPRDLRPGKYRDLSDDQLSLLRAACR